MYASDVHDAYVCRVYGNTALKGERGGGGQREADVRDAYVCRVYGNTALKYINTRGRPLAEKLRPGERVEECCRRGVQEELGSLVGQNSKVVGVGVGGWVWVCGYV